MGDVDEPSPDTALAGPALGYVDFGVAHGLSREALMKAAGLDERLRGDPDARVSTFVYMVLWRELLVGLPNVAVPVEYVRTLDLATLGVGGQILARADDIVHAATLSERFSRLTDTGLAVSWIAFELGYADLKGFYRAFRRWTNTTPAEWRANV